MWLGLWMACGNGSTDDDPVTPWTVWPDEDGDGYGGQVDGTEVTEDQDGWVTNRADCDDDDPTVHPGGLNVCDDGQPLLGDCDDLGGGPANMDDGSDMCTAEFTPCAFYVDDDQDGYGGEEVATFWYLACWFPEDVKDLVMEPGDCDDADPLVHPDATESCDTIDNNCNDHVDEGC